MSPDRSVLVIGATDKVGRHVVGGLPFQGAKGDPPRIASSA
jgi:hypothetical protein